MKHIPTIASSLLGLGFVVFGLMFFFGPAMPPPPEGSPPGLFMGAVGPTGYLAFVKVLEVLGGLLLLWPKTRNFGLLVIGPIIVNILAFHVFLAKCAMILDPVLITICVLAALVLWTERGRFAGLLRG
jgi:putative oxidoreductase